MSDYNKKVTCIGCKRIFNTAGFAIHAGSGTCVEGAIVIAGTIRKSVESDYPSDLKCPHCDKICLNNNSYRNHTRRCSKNPNREPTLFSDAEFQRTKGSTPSNQFIKAEKLGLSKPECSDETRKKHRDNILTRTDEFNRENGKRISSTIINKILNDEWHFVGVKKNIIQYYNGQSFHSSWEIKYAKFLDANGIKWVRNKEWFPYEWEGKEKKYLPDFYLPETDEYVEIKGRKCPKDEAKWSQFPADKKLTILMQTELKNLGIKL